MLGRWNGGGRGRRGGDPHAPVVAWSLIAIRTAVAGAVLAASVAAAAVVVDRTRAEHGRPPVHSADGRFLREVGGQLAMGAELARAVIGQATEPGLRADATAMLVAHEADLARIAGWLDLWDKPEPAMHGYESGESEWSAEMERLSRAEGDALRRMYERLRRRHDSELLEELQALEPSLSRDAVRNLATHLAAEHRQGALATGA